MVSRSIQFQCLLILFLCLQPSQVSPPELIIIASHISCRCLPIHMSMISMMRLMKCLKRCVESTLWEKIFLSLTESQKSELMQCLICPGPLTSLSPTDQWWARLISLEFISINTRTISSPSKRMGLLDLLPLLSRLSFTTSNPQSTILLLWFLFQWERSFHFLTQLLLYLTLAILKEESFSTSTNCFQEKAFRTGLESPCRMKQSLDSLRICLTLLWRLQRSIQQRTSTAKLSSLPL